MPLDERGLPPVDPQTQQIGNLPVFMAGDANGHLPLLHEGADEGHIAGINALAGTPRKFRRRTPLAIVFSDPQVAAVGRRWADLDAHTTITGCASFHDQGRARTALRNAGRLCIYADQATGRLQGAEMCTPQAEHMAHLLALAVQQKLTVRDLLGMPFYHPTYEEGLRTALRDAARQLPQPADSDLATCGGIGVPALE